MDRYGIWLSWNNQQEGFELPILPAEIGVGTGGDGAGYEVAKLGKINVIKDRELSQYTIESFFPAQKYPFVTASILLEPKGYVDYIMGWWATLRPIRFVFVGKTMEINTAASIESFEWREVAGTPGDIEFSLELKEYRFYEARRAQVVEPGAGEPPVIQTEDPQRMDERVPPQTYTLASGDNLWKVAQKVLGNGARWKEIQQLNGISDAQTESLPVGMTLQMPPATGGGGFA